MWQCVTAAVHKVELFHFIYANESTFINSHLCEHNVDVMCS